MGNIRPKVMKRIMKYKSEKDDPSEEIKDRARKNAQEIPMGDHCELCGARREKGNLVRHHWNGYDNPLDVWIICKRANSNLIHDGRSIDEIRKKYNVEIVKNPSLLFEDTCGFDAEFEKKRNHWCKNFSDWWSKRFKDEKRIHPLNWEVNEGKNPKLIYFKALISNSLTNADDAEKYLWDLTVNEILERGGG